jgi:glycerol-3-phosphate cytidylyltransferase
MIKGVIAGAFDVIHPGYVQMFNIASKQCDDLTVLLHEDPSIERPEKLKPILSTLERIEILLALETVKSVRTYKTEQDLYNILSTSNYNIRFQGIDYQEKSFTGDNLSIPIFWISRNHGWSTTKFKKLIAESYEKSRNS